MNRIYFPSSGAADWRQFLADSEKQWKQGASAMELALSWELAGETKRGLPTEVATALDGVPTLADAYLLMALPEHRVGLKGRGKTSQTDVWTLLRKGGQYVSMAVEGKAREPFASTIEEWLIDASEGKKARLDHICQILQIDIKDSMKLRYQLFHRTASAILEAERFGASTAIMIVQSFPGASSSWDDYANFCNLLGADAVRGGLAVAKLDGAISLYLGWVDCNPVSDKKSQEVLK